MEYMISFDYFNILIRLCIKIIVRLKSLKRMLKLCLTHDLKYFQNGLVVFMRKQMML